MIKRLLATTAMAALMTSGAIAASDNMNSTEAQAPAATTQAADTAANQNAPAMNAEGQMASVLIGKAVYSSSADDAERIGEINDLIVTPEGEISSAIIGVGGFLGIGEKSVAVEYSNLEWVDRDGDSWLVYPSSKEQLEQAPAFDRTALMQPTGNAERTDRNDTAANDQRVDDAGTDTAMTGDNAAGNDDGMKVEDETAAANDQRVDDANTDTAMAGDNAAGNDDGTVVQDETAANDENKEYGNADTAMTEGNDDGTMATDETADAQRTVQAGEADTAMTENNAAGNDSNMVNRDETAMTADQDAEANQTDEMQTGSIDRTGMSQVEGADLSAETLIGTTVYGMNDENIGEIGDVLLTAEGSVEGFVIDVGGYLGLGEKPVAVSVENIEILASADGGMTVFTPFTEEALEAQPEYTRESFAADRDSVIMTAPAR